MKDILQEELEKKYPSASSLFQTLVEQDEFAEFLTLPAYDRMIEGGQ